jgi:hypothetical protein
MTDEKKKLNVKRKILIIAASAAALIIAGVLLSLSLSLSRNLKRIEKVFTEQIRSNAEEADLMRQSISIIGRNIEQIRFTLGLPEQTIALPALSEETQQDDENNPAEKYYLAIKTLEQYENSIRISTQKDNLENSTVLKQYLVSQGLTLSLSEDGSGEIKSLEKQYYRIYPSETVLVAESVIGTEYRFDGPPEDFIDVLKEEVPLIRSHYRDIEQMRERFLTITSDSEINAVLEANDMWFSRIEENENTYVLELRKEPNYTVLSLFLDKIAAHYRVLDKEYPDFPSFQDGVRSVLSDIDMRTPQEQLTDRSLEDIRSLFDNDAFSRYLEENDYTLSSEAREDSEYFYFDISRAEEGRLGSFAVQKISGELYLMDEDDVPLTSFRKLFLETDIKKNN